MSLSTLFLAIVLFLYSAIHLGLFAVSTSFLGIVELITAILLFVEGGAVVYKRYMVR